MAQAANRESLKSMDFYIDAGRSLNDLDRSLNHDLKQIQKFFRPIDRLFGDYEVRKKRQITEFLYRKTYYNEPCAIPREEIEKYANDYLLLFYISRKNTLKKQIKDQRLSVNELNVDYCWIKIKEGKISLDLFNQNENNTLAIPPSEILQTYVLDPIKLKHVADLDKARINAFKNKFIAEFRKQNSNTSNEAIHLIFDCITSSSFNEETITKDYVVNFEKSCKKEDNIANSISKDLLDAINLNDDYSKWKNFQDFQEVKIRLGKYKDGRYVIYLHPYTSESNCPIRIPAEE